MLHSRLNLLSYGKAYDLSGMLMLMDLDNLPPTRPYIPQQNVNYDFIMQADKKKRRFSFGGGQGKKSSLLLRIGLGVLTLIVLIFIYNLVFGGGDKGAKLLIDLAAEQQEIARVADIGVRDAVGTEAKNIAVTTKTSVATQQKELTSYLIKKKQKITKEQLAIKKDKTVDKTLTEALENNRFDEVFLEVIKERLTDYSTHLETRYQASSNSTVKKILKSSYESTQNLLK